MSSIALSSLAWRERAPMPLPRAGYIAGVVGKTLALAGGSYWEGDRKLWSARTDFFDPARNEWRPGPALPAPRSDAACVVLGDALYVFGGGANGAVTSSALRLRDGAWEALPYGLPAPRLYPVAAAIGDTIYVLGGLSKAGDYGSADRTMWARERGAWKTMPPLPGPARFSQALAAAGGKLYLFGGATTEGGALRNLDDAWEYDPAAGTWRELPRLPVARRAWWAVPDGARILLLGGYTSDFASEIFSFDPQAKTLSTAGSLPHALADAKFFVIGKRLVGAGGESGNRIRGIWTLEAGL
ncbi:MAG TPA: kelch repeat-containing protein [Bryobacteraceae bacterium]|nr:kelch repeat-containing protein [Bryobacteraceae bacterium]